METLQDFVGVLVASMQTFHTHTMGPSKAVGVLAVYEEGNWIHFRNKFRFWSKVLYPRHPAGKSNDEKQSLFIKYLPFHGLTKMIIIQSHCQNPKQLGGKKLRCCSLWKKKVTAKIQLNTTTILIRLITIRWIPQFTLGCSDKNQEVKKKKKNRVKAWRLTLETVLCLMCTGPWDCSLHLSHTLLFFSGKHANQTR